MKKIILLLTIFIATGLMGAGDLVLAADPATVNTLGAENVETNAANFRGSVVSDGGCAQMSVWFEYGPTETYGSQTVSVSRKGVGEFTIRAVNLTPGTTYHFRAVARNNTGVAAYGSDRIFSTQNVSFETNTDVQNLTLRDSIWYARLRVQPGDFLKYRITIHSTAEIVLQNIMVNYRLPNNVTYKNNLMIKGQPYNGDISRGTINVGNLLPGDSKVITFEAEVGLEANMAYGESILTSTANAYNSNYSSEGSCQIVTTRKGVAGASTVGGAGNGSGNGSNGGATRAAQGSTPTAVSTGISDSIFNSLLLPLLAAGLLVWLFRSRLLGLEEWAQIRKERTERFRVSKKLQRKVEQIRKEF